MQQNMLISLKIQGRHVNPLKRPLAEHHKEAKQYTYTQSLIRLKNPPLKILAFISNHVHQWTANSAVPKLFGTALPLFNRRKL